MGEPVEVEVLRVDYLGDGPALVMFTAPSGMRTLDSTAETIDAATAVQRREMPRRFSKRFASIDRRG